MSYPGYGASASAYAPFLPNQNFGQRPNLLLPEHELSGYSFQDASTYSYGLGDRPSSIIDPHEIRVPESANNHGYWTEVSRHIIDGEHPRLPVYEFPNSSPVPLYDVHTPWTGDYSSMESAFINRTPGTKFARGMAAASARSEQVLGSATKLMGRVGGSATEAVAEGVGSALAWALKNVAYYGTLVSIPAAMVYGMYRATSKAVKALGNFIVKAAKWVGGKLMDGLDWATRPKNWSKYDIRGQVRPRNTLDIGEGFEAKATRGISKGVKSIKRGMRQAGRAASEAVSSASAKVGNAVSKTGRAIGNKAGEILESGVGKARAIGAKASEIASEAYSAGARAGRTAARVGSEIADSKAFKVASGVFQIASDVFQVYMFYQQASELHHEVADYNELKDIINKNMHGETNFQVDEFMRQREASIKQHRINLAVNAGLTVASIGVGATMLATGAAFLGPIGWLAIGICAITVGAAYYMEKLDRDRIKNDDDAWLKKWYGSAEHPSLNDYLLKRDPTGELSGWIKGMHDMLDTSGGDPHDKFTAYMYMLVSKIDVIMDSQKPGLFDDRYEKLAELQSTNPLAGATILNKRWEGQKRSKQEEDNNFIFEEGSLLSSTIDYEVKAGKYDEVHDDVTQEDLDHFFRDQPTPPSADDPDLKEVHDNTYKDQPKPVYTDAEGNVVPFSQSVQWQAAQDRATLTAERKKQGLDAQGAPDYYHEGGWRPTGGQSIRGNWEEIAIKEDEQQAAEEEAEKKAAADKLELDRQNAVYRETEGIENGTGGADQEQSMTDDAPSGPLWHYPENSRESYTQQGLLYDASLAYKRQRL